MIFSQLTPEEKQLVSRLNDLDGLADGGRARYSPFLNERQAQIAEEYSHKYGSAFHLYGGYPGALRRMAGFFPSWQEPDEDMFPIRPITVRLPKGAELSHRDFLGALMSLRITRESIGDIVSSDGRCALFVMESVAPIVLDELLKVGNIGVVCSAGITQLPVRDSAFIPIKGTVASARIDSLVKLLIGCSREKSAALILAERVQLNYAVVREISKGFAEGDVITIRSHGKYAVDKIGTATKKGRLPVVCRKYA